MDKQFEKVINKMEEQSEKANELQNHVSSLFDKVNSTQSNIDKKIENINIELEKVLGTFKKESEKVFNDIKSEFNKKKTDITNSAEEIIGKLKTLQSDYETKVEILIKSIGDKSKEILKIYNELDSIKKIQKDAVKTFDEIEDEQKSIVNKFKKDSQELLKNTDLGNLLHIVDSFESRLAKMEKYAHKHKFGGTKV